VPLPLSDLFLAFGLLLVLEGAPYFLFPRGIPKLLERLARMDPSSVRLMGAVLMAAGLLVIYWVRRHA